MVGLLDLEVSLGLALLQLGRPADAVAALEAVPVDEKLPSTYLNSSLALVYGAVGRTAEALERSRAAMASGTGTYLDVRTALVARALAHARDADRPAMEAAFEQVMNIIDATDSRLSQTVVRLARAIGHEAFDAPDTADLRAETEVAIIQLGARPTGWETAFRLAAGPQRKHLGHQRPTARGESRTRATQISRTIRVGACPNLPTECWSPRSDLTGTTAA